MMSLSVLCSSASTDRFDHVSVHLEPSVEHPVGGSRGAHVYRRGRLRQGVQRHVATLRGECVWIPWIGRGVGPGCTTPRLYSALVRPCL
jgi:hypothetical protein